MSEGESLENWEVWYPRAAATGMLLARGRMDASDTVILHAAAEVITVEVSDDAGTRLAIGRDLERTQWTPMCRLRRNGDVVSREDIWPEESDIGTPVLLPGGEVGILKSWWNAADKMEWRWDLEFYNSRR